MSSTNRIPFHVILGLVITFLALVVAIPSNYFVVQDHEEDFSLELDPPSGNVEQGKNIETIISVESINGYNKLVYLRANGQPEAVYLKCCKI